MKIAVFWGAEHTLPNKCSENTWYSFYNSGWKYGFEKLGHIVDFYVWDSKEDLKGKYDLYLYCPGFLSNKTMLKNIYKPNIFFTEELSLGLCWALAHTYHFDHLCVLDFINYKGLKAIGAKNVHWVPGAVDPTVFNDLNNPERFYNSIFLGNYDKEVIIENGRVRLDYIQAINSNNHPSMVGKGFYAFEANKIWNNTKIGVDVPIAEFSSFRLMQVIASGALCITRKPRVASGFYELGLGGFIPTYDDLDHMLSVIKDWAKNKEIRENLVKMGKEFVANNHTFEHRAKQLLQIAGFEPKQKELFYGGTF